MISTMKIMKTTFKVKTSQKEDHLKNGEKVQSEDDLKNYETYNRSARLLFPNKCLSSKKKQI